MPDIVAVLRASTSDFTAKMAEAKGEVDELSKSGSSNFSKLASVGKAALIGIAGAAVAVGVAAIDFGNKQEERPSEPVGRAQGDSWDKVKGSVDKVSASATKYGDNQATVESALTQGVIATGSYTKAQQGLQVALELSAAKHISLTSAMQTVDKVYAGSNRALTQLGINLDIGTGKLSSIRTATQAVQKAQLSLNTTTAEVASGQLKGVQASGALASAHLTLSDASITLKKDQDAVSTSLAVLGKRLSGQASAAANTFSGRLDAMRAQGENIAAAIGLKLIPILEKMVTVIVGVITWFDKHKAAAIALGVVIGGVLVTAIGVYIASLITTALTGC